MDLKKGQKYEVLIYGANVWNETEYLGSRHETVVTREVHEFKGANGIFLVHKDELKDRVRVSLKVVLKALDNNTDVKTLDTDGDYDDNGNATESISEELEFEIESDDVEVYIKLRVSADGVVTGDGGDYFNPPSYETEWGALEYEDLEIWIDEDEVEITDEQEVEIWSKIKENINF